GCVSCCAVSDGMMPVIARKWNSEVDMKNQRFVKSLIVAPLVCAVVLILFVSRTHSLAVESSAQTPQADKRELVLSLRRDGLRGAAKLKGHYVTDFDPHW